MSQNLSSALKNEKEYHFDEGVGVSLTEHVEALKAQYPTARIQTRRDRDGFAIVKVSYNPEFKYELGKLMDYDPNFVKEHQAETIESLLRSSI